MTTWTCKGALAALALTTLAACEDGQGGLLGALTPTSATATAPLSQAKMAFGAINLVAPDGYCIDKRSLKQNFALLARCDAMNAAASSGGAPLGIITVSVSAKSGTDTLPTPAQIATARGLTDVSLPATADNAVTFRASGTPPSEELSTQHWRGSALIGGKTVGVALYAPTGSRGALGEGRIVLTDMIARSQNRS